MKILKQCSLNNIEAVTEAHTLIKRAETLTLSISIVSFGLAIKDDEWTDVQPDIGLYRTYNQT